MPSPMPNAPDGKPLSLGLRSEWSAARGLPLVQLRDATFFSNGRRLFPRTSWTILPGEHWAIFGPNGSGKSTLAKALWDGVLVVDGRVSYPLAESSSRNGPSPAELSPATYVRHVCFDDQRERVARYSRYLQGRYESLGGDEAPTAAEVLGVSRSDQGRAGGGRHPAPDLVALLGLQTVLDRRLPQLSNGEMRKLLIAEALQDGPRLLILEEPFQGLDGRSRRALSRLLSRITARGVTLVIVTARWRDIVPPVRRVLWVQDGVIAAQGLRRDFTRGGRPAPPGVLASIPPVELHAWPSLPVAEVRQLEGDILVQLRQVTVRFGATIILDRVSWRVREGENWALVGPNGSGKTTLLSLILADNPQAYANDVRVFGRQRGDGESIWEVKERLGHVSPEAQFHQPPGVTALDAICSGFFDSLGLFQGCTESQIRTAKDWAEALDLGNVVNRPFGSLSDGEKRLTLLARALVKNPRLLVLDEPCQGLDDEHRERVLRIVDHLGRQRRFSIIYVTHEQRELPPCIGHVLRLAHGRVKSFKTRRWVLSRR